MSRLALLAVGIGLAVTIAAPPRALAQCADPPLRATLKFQSAPADVSFGALPGPTPIKLLLEIDNCSGAPVFTTEHFSTSDFFRRLYFTDPNGGIVINKAEEALHAASPTFFCLSRQGVLQCTGSSGECGAVPVVPIEALAGPPKPFFRSYHIDDARKLYDLTVPGHYRVNARIELLTFDANDPSAVFDDCDQFEGTTVVNVTALTGSQSFTVVSNELAFQIAGSNAPASDNSDIAGSGPVVADGVAASTVTITLRDVSHVPVAGVTPTFGASGSNNTVGACSATNSSGVATCSLKSTTAEAKTLSLLTPIAKAGGAVTFVAGPVHHIAISPAASTVAAGSYASFTAMGFDAFNNSLGNVTDKTTFKVPGAKCVGRSCTSATPGTYTVTGKTSGKSGTATLTVAAPIDVVRVWVGLASSADNGIKFDLQAVVKKDGTPVATGQLASAVAKVNFSGARLNAIPLLGLSGPIDLSSGTLSLELFVRNACAGSNKASGTARLWFDGAPIDTGATRDAGSRIDPPSGSSSLFFPRAGSLLDPAPGPAKTSADTAVGARCNPYQSFGTWSRTLP